MSLPPGSDAAGLNLKDPTLKELGLLKFKNLEKTVRKKLKLKEETKKFTRAIDLNDKFAAADKQKQN